MELLSASIPAIPVKAVIFDWDGTISTLRYGWEAVMESMMIELLGDDSVETVRSYINESAGIQTIFQMKWLAEQVRSYFGRADDPWEYKAEYNRRLMRVVMMRREAIATGAVSRDGHMITGSEELLKTLNDRGMILYAASGTDDADVKAEAAALGVDGYFKEISGAPPGIEDCPKKHVINKLLGSGIGDADVPGESFAVVGDGKVEIMLGRESGARTMGVASNEETRCSIDPVKRERLRKAGADVITGDFTDTEEIMKFFLGKV